MVDCNKVNVKLSNSQVNKLKSAAKDKTGVTLRIDVKMLNGNNLPHELLLTTILNSNPRTIPVFPAFKNKMVKVFVKNIVTFWHNIAYMWYCKTGVTSHELRVTSWKLKSTSWKLKVRVQSHELRFRIHELRVRIHE